MKTKITILTVLVLFVVLFSLKTSLFNTKKLPRGIIWAWQEEGMVISGRILPFDRLLAVHAPSVDFVRLGDSNIFNPAGQMPYYVKVGGSPLKIVVGLYSGGRKLYLFDDVGPIREVDSGNYDLDYMGDAIGSRHPSIFENAKLDADGNITWIHRDVYIEKIVIIDYINHRVKDVLRRQIKR